MLRNWLLHTLLWEVVGALALGLALGYTAGRLLAWAEDNEMVEQTAPPS